MGVESAWALGYSPARPAGTYPGSAFGMLGFGKGAFTHTSYRFATPTTSTPTWPGLAAPCQIA